MTSEIMDLDLMFVTEDERSIDEVENFFDNKWEEKYNATYSNYSDCIDYEN